MVKPIPKSFLIHEVQYEEYAGNSGWGESYKPSVTLKNVRIESISSITRSNTTELKNFKALLYYDTVNSSATGDFQFNEKSKVTFNGETMYVNKVNPVYGFSLHHYEVELT